MSQVRILSPRLNSARFRRGARPHLSTLMQRADARVMHAQPLRHTGPLATVGGVWFADDGDAPFDALKQPAGSEA